MWSGVSSFLRSGETRRKLLPTSPTLLFYDFVFSISTFLSFTSSSFVPVYCPVIGPAVVSHCSINSFWVILLITWSKIIFNITWYCKQFNQVIFLCQLSDLSVLRKKLNLDTTRSRVKFQNVCMVSLHSENVHPNAHIYDVHNTFT